MNKYDIKFKDLTKLQVLNVLESKFNILRTTFTSVKKLDVYSKSDIKNESHEDCIELYNDIFSSYSDLVDEYTRAIKHIEDLESDRGEMVEILNNLLDGADIYVDEQIGTDISLLLPDSEIKYIIRNMKLKTILSDDYGKDKSLNISEDDKADI